MDRQRKIWLAAVTLERMCRSQKRARERLYLEVKWSDQPEGWKFWRDVYSRLGGWGGPTDRSGRSKVVQFSE